MAQSFQPPAISSETRAAALEKAFVARRARAEVKAALKEGRQSLGEVLDAAEGDPHLTKMKVKDLLRSLPGVGDRRAETIMEEIGIAESRRLGGLGVHQRSALLERFAPQ
ncbi:integration host factor, actinobacterial type [Brevibacterium litoralis]|uniref:integration host factor, actinobacterial type n=1 Tax=Brevibacterium litoralis TaxID=3138935 RepID=UPI0032EADE4E